MPRAQSSRTIFQIDPFFLALPATLPASFASALVYYSITSVPTSFACILPDSCLLSPELFFPLDLEVGITVLLLAPTVDFILLSMDSTALLSTCAVCVLQLASVSTCYINNNLLNYLKIGLDVTLNILCTYLFETGPLLS